MRKRRRIFFLSVSGIISLLFLFQFHSYEKSSALVPNNQRVSVIGKVVSKSVKDTSVQYLLRNVSYSFDQKEYQAEGAFVYYKNDRIPIGAQIRSSGRLRTFSHRTNQGNFDGYNYARSLCVVFSQSADFMDILCNPVTGIGESLYRLRQSLVSVICGSMPKKEAGILAAMVTGEKSMMDPEESRLYQQHGIAHILAISGLHISILGIGLYQFLRKKLHLRFVVCSMISASALLLFASMSGWSVSTRRAVVMFCMLLGAQTAGRTYDTWNALAVAAVILLLIHPLSLTQVSFLLSFSAMLSIVFVLPMVRDLFDYLHVPKAVSLVMEKTGFQLSLSIWIGMLPVTAYFFYYIPVYSVLLNLVVLPLCGLLLGFGLLGAVIGMIWTVPGSLLLMPCRLILKLYDNAMQLSDYLPGGLLVTGQPKLVLMIAYYGIITIAGIVWINRRVISGRILELWNPKIRRRLEMLLFVRLPCAVGAMAVLFFFFSVLPARHTFEISFLDVGQGDAIFIDSSDGTSILVDGGSSSVRNPGIYRLQSFLRYRKIRRIDYWLVSHTDQDHTNAVLEIIQNDYPVHTIVLPGAASAGTFSSGLEEIRRIAARHQIRILYAGEGTTLRTSDFQMECIYPRTSDSASDANALSEVWYLKQKEFRVLLTGDLPEEQERLILERGWLSKTTVLKTAHHGSKYSSCTEFLSAVQPEFAVISVGARNRYGHPGRETLQRLRKSGCSVLQTKDSGQIRFYRDREGMMRLSLPCTD